MGEKKSIGIYLTSMSMGGAERVAVNLATGLINHGYNVDLVLVKATGELLDEVPKEVNIVDLQSSRVLKSLLPLREYLISQQPDILFSMLTEANIVALLAHQMSRHPSRLVISEHNMLSHSSETLKDQSALGAAWALYPLADDIVAVSKGVQDDVVARTRVEMDSVSVIYNPVNVSKIRDHASDTINHRWFNDESINIIISGGRHEPQKGFDTLLDAFSRIERDNIRLILFGSGPESQALKSQAESLGISDLVDFVGFVENPYKYMANANVFVLSSKYEGFGLVLIEALACGCPVISTDCESGPAEILENGYHGQLVPVGDKEAMANAIRTQLAEPSDTQKLQSRADDFATQNIIPKYDLLFQD